MARSPLMRRPLPPGPVQTPRRALALTAAGTRIDPSNAASVKLATAPPRDWQLDALAFYDELGEVRYGARWMGDAISRLRVIPGYQESPADPPVPLESADRPQAEVDAANGAIARIAAGAESGMSGLMRALSINVWLVGESYLVGYEDDDGVEQWEAASVEAITKDPQGGSDSLALRTAPGTAASEAVRLLDPNASMVIRIIRRHPRWRDWPDAAMRGALEYCADLSLLTRMIRATASSRIPAGLLFIPEEASFGTASPADTDGDVSRDPLTDDLLRHMTEPIRTPGDAAAVVPFLIRMSRDDIAAVRQESVDRPIDALAVQLREEARRSLAAVLDLPAEILAGKGDLNHWTAWQVDREAFAIHVEPLAVLILDALTTEYYHLALDAAGVENPGHHRLWYDASGLVATADGSKIALELYDRGEISGEALRTAVGVSQDEAPDDAELARRKELSKIITRSNPTAAPHVPAGGDTGPPPAEPLAASIASLLPEPLALVAALPEVLDLPDPATAAPPPGVSAAQADLDPLALALVAIERELRLRIQAAADELARRALERAGNRLRSLAQKDRSGLASRSLANVPAIDVGSHLGPGVIASIGTSAADLADGALDPLHPRFLRWLGAAFDAIVELLSPWSDPSFDWTPFRARLSDGIEAGWAVLSAGVEAHVAELILNPNVAPPEHGEYDDTVLVPPGIVRACLLAVGGGPFDPSLVAAVAGPVAAQQVGGLITSDMLYEMLARSAGLILGGQGWRWSYGSTLSRVHPFQPHVDLDGTVFTAWDDPRLAVEPEVGKGKPATLWPDTSYYPGDHAYCQCDLVPLIGRASGRSSGRTTETAALPAHMDPARPRFSAFDPNRIAESGAPEQFAAWLQAYGYIPGTDASFDATATHALTWAAQGGWTSADMERLAALMHDLTEQYQPGVVGRRMLSGNNGVVPSFLPDGKTGYLGYYNSGQRISMGARNLTRTSMLRDLDQGFHPLASLESVYAHEFGHLVMHEYVGHYSELAELMQDAILDIDRSPLGRQLRDKAGLLGVGPGDDDYAGLTAWWLRNFLSGYAGAPVSNATYEGRQDWHNGSEGFAELFSIFATPGGCAALSQPFIGEGTPLTFARALRSALNAAIGFAAIPDCH